MLLDDEIPGLTYLKMLCEQIPGLEVVRTFNHPEHFLRDIDSLDFDFCILDIEMPQFNGLHVAALLDKKPIVFITAYRQYAVDAFDLNAVDYLLKPVRKERLMQAIEKVATHIEKANSQKAFVQLNTDKGKMLLFFDQLAYIETAEFDSRDKIAWLKDGVTITLKNISFQRLLSILPEDQFCQINKRGLLALNCVRFFSHDEIITTLLQPDGTPLALTISSAFRNDFVQRVAC